MNDEYYPVGRNQLHVIQFMNRSWQVWLNHDLDFDGVLLGAGDTRTHAIEYALAMLQGATEVLQGTPSPDDIQKMMSSK